MNSKIISIVRQERHRSLAMGAAVAVIAVTLGACGGGDDSSLSSAAQQGKETSLASGCSSCHGVKGQGGVGPSWIDLAGSDVELADGSIVVADDDYLIRSIAEPEADVVAGSDIAMPVNNLTEQEIADVVAYIKELTTDES